MDKPLRILATTCNHAMCPDTRDVTDQVVWLVDSLCGWQGEDIALEAIEAVVNEDQDG